MAPLFLKGKCSHCVHCLLFICLFNQCQMSMERKVQKGCSRGALTQQRRPKDVPLSGPSFSLPLSFSLPSFLSPLHSCLFPSPTLSFFFVCFPFVLFCCILTGSLNCLTTWVVTEFPWGFGGSPVLTKSRCQCGVPFCVDRMQSTGLP